MAKHHISHFLKILFIYSGTVVCGQIQRFDGWYNNFGYPSWGCAGESLVHNISSAYEDYTYKPVTTNRPSPRLISEALFHQNSSQIRSGSYWNRTALFAFFSQLVQYEITSTDQKSCPAELLTIPVPRCDREFDPACKGGQLMPYERIKYNTDTGQSPNAPRRQTNDASSFIDGSYIYGTSAVRASYLRKEGSARLASKDNWGKFPELNDIRLPYLLYPARDHKLQNPEKLWKFGDPHVHENPGLLSLSLLFFRYHNYLASRFENDFKNLSSVEIFFKTRKWTIASLQNIIMYEWLPKLLNVEPQPYEGYKSSVEPSISAIFDAAAIRYTMTLIPSGIVQMAQNCNYNENDVIRICNSFFRSQEIIQDKENGYTDIIRGLTKQQAEREDMYVVEDLQSKYFGPLHYSRHDYVALTIMRGRDYGLPDYNTVRRQMGLKAVQNWEDINPNLARTNPEVFNTVKSIYKRLEYLDAFVGGMLETDEKPGPLFTSVILDQFHRIRDGDKFWFENENSGLFTRAEIQEIRKIRLSDIIRDTGTVEMSNLQEDVFTLSNDSICDSVYLIADDLEYCDGHQGFDYFAGSEVVFIVVWICFGLIPFVCIISAYIAAKCRQWKHEKEVKKRQTKTITNFSNDKTASDKVTQHLAYEWVGEKAEPRPVVVKMKTRCQVDVSSSTGRNLRTINLINQDTVDVLVAVNKRKTLLMIKVPKEYDIVLQFGTYSDRQKFENALIEALEANHIACTIHEVKAKTIYSKAFTQDRRNARLEKFFKSVFSKAFQMDYDPGLDNEDTEQPKTKETLDIELSKQEFAQALAVKQNSDFVENMFSMLDSDQNGYITFREFLNAVVLFSKGSCHEKLELLFGMFDVESKGFLQKSDLTKMFSSLLDMASSNLNREEVHGLVASICQQHGLDDGTQIKFEDFCQILSPQMDKIWNAGLDWKGQRKCYPSTDRKKSSESGRKRMSLSREKLGKQSGSMPSLSSDDGSSKSQNGSDKRSQTGSESRTRFIAVREKYSPVKARVKSFAHFIENNRQHIFYLILFFGITVILFAERFYYYTVEREHSGLRMVMSYGISVTRGAAAAMSFNFSLLLLTVCRNIITWLRETFLNLYIPFDSHITFHKVVAWTALFFTALHVIGYGFNFYHVVTQPTSHLCIFDSIVLRAEDKPGIVFWFFGNMTGFTGVLLVVLICIVYIYATQTARRFIFNGFWFTHKLIVLMYILTILHGASVIVQRPMFFTYFVGPAILFTIDKMISLSRKKTELAVIKAEKLPSDITLIEFKRPSSFVYKSGQWVRIACVSQGKNEYHPFTLTSAPHEDTLCLHIRALGPWTWNIRHEFDPENHRDIPYPPLYLDGPYGAGQQDWYQYEVSVLVGAGIGVTPYASILKDFVHMASIKSMYKMKCQKLYFIWVTGSQRHYEWLLDIIREVEEVDDTGLVSIDIFITQFFQNFDLRTAMLYICEEHFQKLSGGRSVFTGLKATTHFGRPQLNTVFQSVHKTHPMVKKVGVFSCGPPGLTKSVEQGCITASNTTRALFEHHFENF